jgi:phosphatidylglycerophosphate synthase
MAGGYTLAQVQETYKPRDAWWTVLLVDPLASRLVKVTANRTNITPNQLSFMALLLGLVSAGLFWNASTWALIVGALIYHLAFVLDCMDGKVARLKGTGSILGSWLDYVFDRIRVFICALALFGGQYRETDDWIYLLLASVVIFLDALRYMDALQISKVRASMTRAIETAAAEAGVSPAKYLPARDADEDADRAMEDAGLRRTDPKRDDAAPAAADVPAHAAANPDRIAATALSRTELHTSFKSRFGAYLRVRELLLKHRIRPHLFSGIEFQMFVFIVAPFTTLILPVTVLSAVLLLVFELAIIYKLVLSTRDLDGLLAKIHASAPDSPR